MQVQNRSFQVVNWKKTAAKCTKLKNARAKRAKLVVFKAKYANLWRSRLPGCPGYLSSLLSFPHRLPFRFESSFHTLLGFTDHSKYTVGFRNERKYSLTAPKVKDATDNPSPEVSLASYFLALVQLVTLCLRLYPRFHHFEVGQEFSKYSPLYEFC